MPKSNRLLHRSVTQPGAATRGEEAAVRLSKAVFCALLLSGSGPRSVDSHACRNGEIVCDFDSSMNGGTIASGYAETVWSMIRGFANRSVSDYVAQMADDFHFTSDDSAFQARFPAGWNREDERIFATRLFEGGASGGNGEALPTALRVDLEDGPGIFERTVVRDSEATVLLDHYHVIIRLSDGQTLDLGNSRCEFTVIVTGEGFRVSRWTETVDRVFDAETRTKRADQGEPPAAIDTLAAVPPLRLTLRFRPERKDAMVFDLILPRDGAVLETFDLMGRRVGRRDLSHLKPGRHSVSFDPGDYANGVYWARLRSGREGVTRKVVWVK
jgi:hypothetical protein